MIPGTGHIHTFFRVGNHTHTHTNTHTHTHTHTSCGELTTSTTISIQHNLLDTCMHKYSVTCPPLVMWESGLCWQVVFVGRLFPIQKKTNLAISQSSLCIEVVPRAGSTLYTCKHAHTHTQAFFELEIMSETYLQLHGQQDHEICSKNPNNYLTCMGFEPTTLGLGNSRQQTQIVCTPTAWAIQASLKKGTPMLSYEASTDNGSTPAIMSSWYLALVTHTFFNAFFWVWKSRHTHARTHARTHPHPHRSLQILPI